MGPRHAPVPLPHTQYAYPVCTCIPGMWVLWGNDAPVGVSGVSGEARRAACAGGVVARRGLGPAGDGASGCAMTVPQMVRNHAQRAERRARFEAEAQLAERLSKARTPRQKRRELARVNGEAKRARSGDQEGGTGGRRE